MTPARRRSVATAALVYARRGWPVLPCHTPVRGRVPCSCGHVDCGSPGKHPRVRGGLHAATADDLQVRLWWDRWPSANVGIRTGAESGLVVIDVDPDHAGERSLDALVERHGPFYDDCRTVRTGSGGLHFYFRHPGVTVRNDTGRRLGSGIDVRGDGGYVLAPPSLHASGRLYQLAANGTALPELPEWLVDRLTREPERPSFPTTQHVGVLLDRWAEAALNGELQRLHGAVEGSRNDTLNRIAFRLGQIVAAGGLEEGRVEEVLVEGARATGLREREAVRTVQSGLRAGEQWPRGPRFDRGGREMDVNP
jgi:hypothetical protein